MMDEEEYKLWRKQQHKKLKLPKKRRPILYSDRNSRQRAKTAKYGIYKLTKRLPGSFTTKA